MGYGRRWVGCAAVALSWGCGSDAAHVDRDAGVNTNHGARTGRSPQEDGGGAGGRAGRTVDASSGETGGRRVTGSADGSPSTDGSPHGPDGSCVETRVPAESTTITQTVTHHGPAPIDLYILWDQSRSMSCPATSSTGGAGGTGGATGPTRWDAVKGPLLTWLESVHGDPPLNVGITYFGMGGMGLTPLSSCNVADYQYSDVEIAPVLQNVSEIEHSIDLHSPSTDTPTFPALQGAVNHCLNWKTSHPDHVIAVLLVTDGQPNGCGTIQDVENVATTAWNNGAGVRTFVLGVTSPGISCDIDSNPPNVADLDAVAVAGGTQKALVVDVTQNMSNQLISQLDITRSQLTKTNTTTEVETRKDDCVYHVPVIKLSTRTLVLDKDALNLDFTTSQGARGRLYRVDSLDACSKTDALAWYYDDNGNPTQILLCPDTCRHLHLTSGDGGLDAGPKTTQEVDIALGCKSAYAPHN